MTSMKNEIQVVVRIAFPSDSDTLVAVRRCEDEVRVALEKAGLTIVGKPTGSVLTDIKWTEEKPPRRNQ